MKSGTYVGEELDLFASASAWKAYVGRTLAPYVRGDVLEVGAGLGGSTGWLCRAEHRRWVCLEPDATLANRLRRSMREGVLPVCSEVVVGTIAAMTEAAAFDTLLYIDVLEHVADDAAELALASARLRPGGHLIVLAPAHPWLYSAFDQAVGHHRRYTRASLRAVAPPGLRMLRLDYLDTVGLLASLGNRVVLRKAMPSACQIAIWDKVMVRLSRVVDPLLGYSCGKSVLGVWQAGGSAHG